MKMLSSLFFLAAAVVALTSCGGQVKAKGQVAYRFVHGKTALLQDGVAYAPRRAPAAVKRAIEAGNRLQNKSYKWGGGHAVLNDSGYDCSGSVSYFLREAGVMKGEFWKISSVYGVHLVPIFLL